METGVTGVTENSQVILQSEPDSGHAGGVTLANIT